ncbi:MAG: ubiquinol-cytochrome c reductase iron-sulfur subunit [Nitrospirae bacterium]|nr:MAG: ubiquinol-cytochrome c reductase iron-sulfur subunit [Nitrospirota bacterium]
MKGTFLIFGISTASSLIFFYPPDVRRRKITFFPVIEEEKRPKKGVKIAYFSYKHKGRKIERSIFLVASPKEKDGFIALSPICTHLGCRVYWDWAKKEFRCPCHGGRYDALGRVIAGPPPAPLHRLPVKIVNGMINVGLKV